VADRQFAHPPRCCQPLLGRPSRTPAALILGYHGPYTLRAADGLAVDGITSRPSACVGLVCSQAPRTRSSAAGPDQSERAQTRRTPHPLLRHRSSQPYCTTLPCPPAEPTGPASVPAPSSSPASAIEIPATKRRPYVRAAGRRGRAGGRLARRAREDPPRSSACGRGAVRPPSDVAALCGCLDGTLVVVLAHERDRRCGRRAVKPGRQGLCQSARGHQRRRSQLALPQRAARLRSSGQYGGRVGGQAEVRSAELS
jgi:hypothetical protein